MPHRIPPDRRGMVHIVTAIVALRFHRGRGRPPGSRTRKAMARPVDHRAREMSAWRHLCIAFGARVRFLREEQGISARGLATAIGCSKAVVWAWERGETIPSVPVLLMAAAALDCSLVDLMPDEAHHRVEPIRERAA